MAKTKKSMAAILREELASSSMVSEQSVLIPAVSSPIIDDRSMTRRQFDRGKACSRSPIRSTAWDYQRERSVSSYAQCPVLERRSVDRSLGSVVQRLRSDGHAVEFEALMIRSDSHRISASSARSINEFRLDRLHKGCDRLEGTLNRMEIRFDSLEHQFDLLEEQVAGVKPRLKKMAADLDILIDDLDLKNEVMTITSSSPSKSGRGRILSGAPCVRQNVKENLLLMPSVRQEVTALEDSLDDACYDEGKSQKRLPPLQSQQQQFLWSSQQQNVLMQQQQLRQQHQLQHQFLEDVKEEEEASVKLNDEVLSRKSIERTIKHASEETIVQMEYNVLQKFNIGAKWIREADHAKINALAGGDTTSADNSIQVLIATSVKEAAGGANSVQFSRGALKMAVLFYCVHKEDFVVVFDPGGSEDVLLMIGGYARTSILQFVVGIDHVIVPIFVELLGFHEIYVREQLKEKAKLSVLRNATWEVDWDLSTRVSCLDLEDKVQLLKGKGMMQLHL